MNPAAFPKFTKLYARAKMEGKYEMEITYRILWIVDYVTEKISRHSEQLAEKHIQRFMGQIS